MQLIDYYKEQLGIDNVPKWFIKYMNVESLQRLKKVTYHCGMEYASNDIYSFKETITRYDHSITTALLVYKYAKALKMDEHSCKRMTLAALFHDIATPAFSHVIDYMHNDYEKQESTEDEEKGGKLIVQDKKLLSYLKYDNVKFSDVIYYKQFSLVDSDRPMLCADRLDGIILSGMEWSQNITEKEIDIILNDISIYKNENKRLEFGFKSKKVGEFVCQVNKNINALCHSYGDNYMMDLMAQTIKLAIEKKCLLEDDLYKHSEKEIIEKLYKSGKADILLNLYDFEHKTRNEIPKSYIKSKVRIINPIVGGRRLYKNK